MHAISLAAALLFAVPAYAAEVVQSEIDVIDGGTIRVHGETIHIVGIDAPKLGQAAHCGVERMLAARATSRLRPIIRSGERIEVDRVACSCRPGMDGAADCAGLRNCGELKVDGVDAGDMLIAENLAHPYACGPRGCPRRKPWRPFETQ